MYQFYGILDRSSHRTDGDHLQSIATIQKKFPLRTAAFNLIRHEGFFLFGSHIRSSRIGLTELFMIGEIYNQAEWGSSGTASASLEHVLLEIYLKHGQNAFADLNGSFVIIVLDHESGKCRIINDQMGTLQVFYYADRDFILFGSELKYLFCHPRCPRNIDWTSSLKRPIPFLIINAERHYDAWFKDIKLLEEGRVLEIRPEGKIAVTSYWNPWSTANPSGVLSHLSRDQQAEQYSEAYLALLEDAVQLRSKGPGSSYAMFSGGVDSTIIAALATRYGNVDTFSFATQATVRDGATAMCIRLAQDLGVANTQVVIPFDDLVTDGQLWTKHIWSMESPLAHKDAIGKTALHAAISSIQPAAMNIMSGTGSDQLNGGLVRWFIENADDQVDLNWDRVMTEIHTEMLKPVIGHQYDTFWGSRDLLHHDYLSSLSSNRLDENLWPDFVHGCLHANNFILVWDELRAGAWHHRGVRFPFMDHRFVPFILGIPTQLHSRLFFDKHILRSGAQGILPSYLTNKPKAPVIKPGEDQRMKMYKEILLGNGGIVLDSLLSSIQTSNLPVDRLKFETKVRQLSDHPDQAGWAYLMHIAGLVMLDSLPDQDESAIDMSEHIMRHVEVINASSPSVMNRISEKLSEMPEDELLRLPLSYGSECSLVCDVFTDTCYLVRDGEMCYQLDDDCPDWRLFLKAVDNVRDTITICADEHLDLETFREYLLITLGEGILYTHKDNLYHASA